MNTSRKTKFQICNWFKQISQGVKNAKNCILTINFTFSGQLGSLITSRHVICQIYFRLERHFKLWKFSFQDQVVHKIAKKSPCRMVFFFQFLMLNISSIKELLHKPSEIQWNITGTLPGKLKRKLSWAYCYF